MNEYITWPAIITAVGAVLVTAGAFWSSIEAAKESRASAARQLNYHNELKAKDDLLFKKQEQIESLNTEIKQSITGGDSYPVATALVMSKNNQLDLMIHNAGKYLLYNLQVNIFDRDMFASIISTSEKGDGDKYVALLISANEQSTIVYDLGTIAPAQGRKITGFKLDPKKGKKNLGIRFMAVNGPSTEELRLRLIGSEWKSAYKITRHGKVVDELSNAGFPDDQLP